MWEQPPRQERETAGHREGGGGMKILVGMLFLALTLGAVWEKVDVYRTGYAIEQLRMKKKHVQQEQRALELQLATLTSPEHIERVASAQLGMVRARYDQ